MLTNLIKKVMCRFVAYYSNGKLYSFDYSAQRVSFSEKPNRIKKPIFLIVSRNYYKEKSLDYPLEDSNLLKKALKLEFYDTDSKFILGDLDSGRRYINIWEFSKNLPKSIFIVPETYLLANDLMSNHVIIKNDVYIARSKGTIRSHIKNLLINNVEKFCLSASIQSESDEKIDENKLPRILLDGFLNSNKKDILSFLNLPKSVVDAQTNKIAFFVFAGVISFYFLLTSLWLLWQQNTIDKNLLENTKETVEVLELQNKFMSLKSELNALNELLLTQEERSTIWLILSQLFEETNIKSVRFVDNRYIIIGEVEQATTLLEKLLSLSQVSDARFDVPVRKTKKIEYYNISFKMKS